MTTKRPYLLISSLLLILSLLFVSCKEAPANPTVEVEKSNNIVSIFLEDGIIVNIEVSTENTGGVVSKVIDGSGNGLPGITVELENATNGELTQETQTNSEGVFYFANVEPGRYRIDVPMDGEYQMVDRPRVINIEADNYIAPLFIEMQPMHTTLEIDGRFNTFAMTTALNCPNMGSPEFQVLGSSTDVLFNNQSYSLFATSSRAGYTRYPDNVTTFVENNGYVQFVFKYDDLSEGINGSKGRHVGITYCQGIFFEWTIPEFKLDATSITFYEEIAGTCPFPNSYEVFDGSTIRFTIPGSEYGYMLLDYTPIQIDEHAGTISDGEALLLSLEGPHEGFMVTRCGDTLAGGYVDD